ncbi:sugar O-acetyltransferase [Maribacter dokdonensis]|uniref:sugar O-acetyltransferase n=1 Tax=Maribacter dokdonensis TaxID=320912 RepID=UPI0032872DD6
MSEKEKMTQGLPYDPNNAELVKGRLSARRLLREITAISEDEEQDRKMLFRKLFAETGDEFYIENPFICDYGFNIYWGENAYANFGCIILDAAPVYIGKNVMMAPGVKLMTATHPLEYKARNSGIEFAKPIHIGDNVWIGSGVIVNPGVKIGNNSVIGSGSVVVKDIPENVVAVGNPCKVMKSIDNAG